VHASSKATHLCRNTCISDEEVDSEEGDEDNAAADDTNAAAAADTSAAADDAADDNNNYATMPPKFKAPPRKPGAKKIKGESNDVAAMPPPTPKLPVNFSIDLTDKFLVAYHCEGSQDLADMVFQVNGVLHADIDYHVSVAADRKSISWQRAIRTICFSKRILEAILKGDYSKASHRAVAYDDVAQEMHEKKICPERKLYWGAPQVVHLKWECTGAITIIKRNYEIDYVNVDSKGRKNRQCNSVVIIQAKKAKERAEMEAEVTAEQISLFGTFSQSSHGSSGKHPSPPPRRKSQQRNNNNNRGHEVDDDDKKEQFPEEDDEDADNGGGGRRGGGYSGDRGGGGKRKRWRY